jgi:hypothetical protein
VIAELDRQAGRCVGEEIVQQRLAPDKRRGGEVPGVEVEEVESKEDELVARASAERVLQRGEMADARVVEHDDLAVDHRLAAGQCSERGGQVAVPMGPVEAAAGDEPHDLARPVCERAVAVELDLVQPVVPTGGAAAAVASCGWRRSGMAARTAPGSALGRSRRGRAGVAAGADKSPMRRPDFTLSGRSRRMSR